MQLPTLIGVVHLPPLPGSPRASSPIDEIVRTAVGEAALLQDCGFQAVILENFGDVPFFPIGVPPITVASMTACACEVRKELDIGLGINVLRNDPQAALAIAFAASADFIRINVHCGARLTDQGIIEGIAHETVRQRSALGAADRIALYCDVDVKHAAPLASRSIADEAEEVVERALADVVLVTGPGTGRAVRLNDLREVRARLKTPLFAASGVTPQTMHDILEACDGVIVGSALRRDGKAGAPLAPERVMRIAEAFANCLSAPTQSQPAPVPEP